MAIVINCVRKFSWLILLIIATGCDSGGDNPDPNEAAPPSLSDEDVVELVKRKIDDEGIRIYNFDILTAEITQLEGDQVQVDFTYDDVSIKGGVPSAIVNMKNLRVDSVTYMR